MLHWSRAQRPRRGGCGGRSHTLTSNLRWAAAPGNVALNVRVTGLPKDSVANVTQLVTLDRSLLAERTGSLPAATLDLVLSGVDQVLGRP